MKARSSLLFVLFLVVLGFTDVHLANGATVTTDDSIEMILEGDAHGGGHALPPLYIVLPFVILLLAIATGPLFYAHFWEHHYPKISMILGSITVIYYMFVMDNVVSLLHSLEEYISFIALLTALFVASGGILIKIDRKATPAFNTALLLVGSILANFAGTTGASMLLIRPFMRMNTGRLKAYHIVFFIFTVSNCGGALTPIGDPPLFLGFLKGVPFFWIVSHVWHIWLVGMACILGVFFVIDSRNKSDAEHKEAYTGKITVQGGKSFGYLLLVIIFVFLDPNVIAGFPSLQKMLHVPFGIREVLMFAVAWISYKTADKEALRSNEFNFLPIKEVAWLFVGIFATMIPALELIASYAKKNAAEFTVSKFYWFTGGLSGVLDNAPTYLNFLSGSLGKFGLSLTSSQDVLHFSEGVASPIAGDAGSITYLMAISIAAVFFGSMTYIGNAPNFMVKNIAEQAGAEVPSFVGYLFKFSLPILIPIFLIVWLIFFNL